MDSTLAGALLGLGLLFLFLLVIMALPLYSILRGFSRRRAAQHEIATKEPQLQHLVRTSVQAPDHVGTTTLVTGAVAYAADAPSRWVTSWRNLFGGSAVSMTEQADLARRLATIRMLEEAQALGASGVANVRMETNELFSSQRQQGMMVVEMLAYGTALVPAETYSAST